MPQQPLGFVTPSILILCATLMEIAPLIADLQNRSEFASAQGRRIITGEHKGKTFAIVISGPGMINAAQTLSSILEHHNPELVVQTGIAGIFRQSGLRIGDICIAESERYLHTGIESETSQLFPSPLPFDLIENLPSTREALFFMEKHLVGTIHSCLKTDNDSSEYKIKIGRMITVSTVTSTQQTADLIYQRFNPCMEAMEGAASAQVACLYDTPFIEVRAGSNITGVRKKSSWDIPLASQHLSHACRLIIEKFQIL